MGLFDRFRFKKKELKEDDEVLNQSLSSINKELERLKSQKCTTIAGSKVCVTPLTHRRKRKMPPKKIKRSTRSRPAKKSKHHLAKHQQKRKQMKSEKDLLKGALHDLDKELRSLRSSKRHFENRSQDVSSELDSTQNREVNLRNQISELMKKEALLIKRKNSIKDKMNTLDKRIEKVRTIERELRDVR
ncbi:MAG: hypothetical protein Q8R37_01135 [Nanoarchaeota archaeon]|nr:hypothetical protein [Nanoarchaeota archaeon]